MGFAILSIVFEIRPRKSGKRTQLHQIGLNGKLTLDRQDDFGLHGFGVELVVGLATEMGVVVLGGGQKWICIPRFTSGSGM